MNKNEDERKPLPPYIAFKTFLGFIQKLKETTVPERIDASVVRNYSGSVARQLFTALKYLSMTDENGKVTEKLTQLVDAHGSENWKMLLGNSIKESYFPIIGDLNLEKATRNQLEEKFRDWGADGDVLQKCMAFYISAVTEAGMAISPHVLASETRGRPKGSKTKKPKERGDEQENETLAQPTVPGIAKFSFPIPGLGSATIYVPEGITTDDWTMVNSMMEAFIKRKAKGDKV